MRIEFDRKDLMNMGHTPYGYRIENGNAVIEPKEAEAVVKMCEGYLDGLSLIEQITVHENGTFTVEFKSGTMVEV